MTAGSYLLKNGKRRKEEKKEKGGFSRNSFVRPLSKLTGACPVSSLLYGEGTNICLADVINLPWHAMLLFQVARQSSDDIIYGIASWSFFFFTFMSTTDSVNTPIFSYLSASRKSGIIRLYGAKKRVRPILYFVTGTSLAIFS